MLEIVLVLIYFITCIFSTILSSPEIIEIVYNFLTTEKKILRYTKISKAVDSIKLKTINETNLAGMKASKFSNKLMLYK